MQVGQGLLLASTGLTQLGPFLAFHLQEGSYGLDWAYLHVCRLVEWPQMGQLRRFRSTPVDLCSQQAWQKNKRGTENAQLLSQASTFCKFATLPLAKASYMARNSQYGRPLTKGMSEKRGKKLGVLIQAINHQWHLEQQL